MVEYNLGLPIALVEYKHHDFQIIGWSHPTYRALAALASSYGKTPGGLPFFVAVYWPVLWAFQVYPMNRKAEAFYEFGQEMTEQEYVTSLYQIRAQAISNDILAHLNTMRPDGQEHLHE